MKKFLILNTLLAIIAVILMGCSQPTSGSSDPFDDCTKTTDKIEYSNGTWTINYTISGKSSGYSYIEEDTIKALASSSSYLFTSGTSKITMKTAEVLGDDYNSYKALSDTEKEQVQNTFLELLKYQIRSTGIGSITDASMNDDNIVFKLALSDSYLRTWQRALNPENLPRNTEIKTNSNKTKYVLTVPQSDGTKLKYYISKD